MLISKMKYISGHVELEDIDILVKWRRLPYQINCYTPDKHINIFLVPIIYESGIIVLAYMIACV